MDLTRRVEPVQNSIKVKKSDYVASGSTIGSSPVKIVGPDSNRFKPIRDQPYWNEGHITCAVE